MLLSNFTTKNDGTSRLSVACAENTHNTVYLTTYAVLASRAGVSFFSIFLFSTLCCETHLTH